MRLLDESLSLEMQEMGAIAGYGTDRIFSHGSRDPIAGVVRLVHTRLETPHRSSLLDTGHHGVRRRHRLFSIDVPLVHDPESLAALSGNPQCPGEYGPNSIDRSATALGMVHALLITTAAFWYAGTLSHFPAQMAKEEAVLYTIAVVLLILWLLGLVTGYTIGAFIHVLLVIALVLVLVQFVSGRRVV